MIGEQVELGYEEDRCNKEMDDFGGNNKITDGEVEPVKNKEGDRVL